MRYLNIQSFKKHFENASNGKVKIYLVVLSNPYERERIISYILSKINAKQFNLSKFSKDSSLNSIINTFQSPSLLGGEPLIIVEDIEGFSKDDIQKLNNFIKVNEINLIVGAQNKQATSVLYSTVEKRGLVFDLSSEKIWEKEKRIANFAFEKCLRAKKNISSIVIEALFDKVGLDLALVEQEIDKLITFIGERRTIELEDIEIMCPVNVGQSVWQLAEEIVWDEINFDSIKALDAAYFHLLISAIRYQLQLGLKIASLIESKKTQELNTYFPKIYPRALEKKRLIAKKFTSNYYKKAIKDLFEIDVLSKTINFNFSYFLDLLKTKLLYLSTYEFNSSS